MNTKPPNYDRMIELLAGRALGDLDPVENNELDLLLSQLTPVEARSLRSAQADFEGLKGATLAGWSSGDGGKVKLPADLRARILTAGQSVLANGGSSVAPPASGMRLREKFAWLTAAASIALAVFAWSRPAGPATSEPAWQARAQLVKEANTKTVSWANTEDPSAKGVSGDIVWNAQQQRGYMRFKGLAQNDPRLQQYQLWIFDKGREGEFPVDGGVFDISAASKDPTTGDLVVPIAPKLAVRDPALFAVTIEMPGGVVVTKKERLLLLAKTDQK